MSFDKKVESLRNQVFDKMVSIGVRCIPSTTMVSTRFKQETYTFDWVQSNPQIVLDCIQDNFKKYNNFGKQKVSDKYDMHIRYDKFYNTKFPKTLINEYGMCFTHYTSYPNKKFIDMCKRRSDRFMNLLNSKEKILFIYMNDKQTNLQKKQYNYLIQLRNYLIQQYPDLDFTILALHDIKEIDSERIINLQTIRKKGSIMIAGKMFGTNYDNAMAKCLTNIFKSHPKYPQQALFH